jgi:hypothetical protein
LSSVRGHRAWDWPRWLAAGRLMPARCSFASWRCGRPVSCARADLCHPLASRRCGRRPLDVASACTLPPPSLCLAIILRCATLRARLPAVQSSLGRGSAAAALIFRSGSTCLAEPIPLPLAPLFLGLALPHVLRSVGSSGSFDVPSARQFSCPAHSSSPTP